MWLPDDHLVLHVLCVWLLSKCQYWSLDLCTSIPEQCYNIYFASDHKQHTSQSTGPRSWFWGCSYIAVLIGRLSITDSNSIGWSMNEWITDYNYSLKLLALLNLVLLMSQAGACWGSLAGWDWQCQSAMLNSPLAALEAPHCTVPAEYQDLHGTTGNS